MIKKLLVSSLLCYTIAFGSYQEAFMEYLEQSGTKDLMTPNAEYIARIMGDLLPADTNPTKAQRQKIYDIIANTTQATIAESMPQIQAVFAYYLSESDLREIIAFYRTPVGKKLAANLMPMQEQTQKIVFNIMQKHLQTMTQQITQVLHSQPKDK
ncbi:DUF2059 domain-containing protein [uncultured Helicobacter sp.]|uniref:DUF2059 domain-containing protein n=1 Tax=uncultured Helicobacter sp. TaxID=175537 RepID=UPI00374FAFE8